MAKPTKDKENKMKAEMAKLCEKYNCQFLRLYDTFSSRSFGHAGHIPPQPCDCIIITPNNSVAFQIECKSSIYPYIAFSGLFSDAQTKGWQNAYNRKIHWIMLHYLESFDGKLSGYSYYHCNWIRKYFDEQDSRPRKTLSLDIFPQDIVPLEVLIKGLVDNIFPISSISYDRAPGIKQ